MNNRLFTAFYPFFAAGLLIVGAIFAIVLLSLLIIKAIIVGAVLFSLVWLKKQFFPLKIKPVNDATTTQNSATTDPHAKRKPYTFEHGEY